MIHKTLWSPDTCDCQIEYEWDDSVPDDQRQHSLSNIVSKCPAHAALNTTDIFSTVLDENPRKNNALGHVLDNAPTGLFDTTPEGARILKGNITYNFSWSGIAPNRVLNISFTGITLTSPQRNALQTALNSRFGSGKIVLS